MATVDDKNIIFSMVGVSKIIPQNHKQILKDIYLSFFYGAKIGIIGLNGAGKSTLMKIIAGLEQPTQGEVVWSPGYTLPFIHIFDNSQHLTFAEEIVKSCFESCISWT